MTLVIKATPMLAFAITAILSLPLAVHAGASQGDATVATLSVAPLDHVEYPLDRPQWIEDTGDHLDPSEGKDVLIAVTSGPAPSPEIASEMMEVMARGAVENYVEKLAQMEAEPIDPGVMKVELEWVRDELISRQYDGTVKTGDTVQYESACLLRLDADHQKTLNQIIQNHRLRHRLAAVGVVGVLALIALLGGSIFFGWASSRQNARRTVVVSQPEQAPFARKG